MVLERAAQKLQERWSFRDFNYRHFRPKLIVTDLLGTVARMGIKPGEVAPDFSLPDTEGQHFSLAALRGTPVLLRFGSTT